MIVHMSERDEMMENILKYGLIEQMGQKLREDEKSRATIDKYQRDVRAFINYAGEGAELTKETVICFKEYLGENYEVSSANSMLAAVNYFLRFIERCDCVVKAFKVQQETFRREEQELTREEYFRLLDAAREEGNDRLLMLMQTICATGIRISELRFVTVEALLCHGLYTICLRNGGRWIRKRCPGEKFVLPVIRICTIRLSIRKNGSWTQQFKCGITPILYII